MGHWATFRSIWAEIQVWKKLVCMAIQDRCGRVAQLHGLSRCPESGGSSSENATRAKRFDVHIPVDTRLPAILVVSHGFYVAQMQR